MSIKTLLGGCSFSDYCGFGDPVSRNNLPAAPMVGNHNDDRCWYNIVRQNLDLDLTNVSYGGYSNEEILAQITKNLMIYDGYQLVIIQLTSTGRKWFYRSDDPFEFVLLHGTNSHDANEKKLFESLRVDFNNELVEIEKTMSHLLLIQAYLQQKRVALLLINGVNFGAIIKHLITDAENFCRRQIPSYIWDIKGKIYAQQLAALAGQINLENFLFFDHSLESMAIDKADDHVHPGAKSNRLYADIIGEKISHMVKRNQNQSSF